MASQNCGNCYEHCAKCFKEPVSGSISSSVEPFDERFTKYFEEVLRVHESDPAPTLQKGDLVRMSAYPGGQLYTDYELRYTLKQVTPEARDLGSWTGPFRLEGGHTHYGWKGWASFELPVDALGDLAGAGLRAMAERAIRRGGH